MATRRWEGEFDAAPAAPSINNDDSALPTEEATNQPNEAPSGARPQRRKRIVLSESQLLSEEGLPKVVRTFPLQVPGSVAGQEGEALHSLIKMYKQWAYDLYPGLNFEDFVDRTETLGKSHEIQGFMSDFRTKEMRRVQGLAEDPSGDPDRPDDAMQDEDDELLEMRILGAYDDDDEEEEYNHEPNANVNANIQTNTLANADDEETML